MDFLKKIQVLDGGHLKWVALITMTIDHIGAFLYPQYMVLRLIGRIAFPLFCFELVEGIIHTKNKKKYGIRLTIFAILCEPIFDLIGTGKMVSYQRQSVMITLLIGFLVLCFWQWDWKVHTKGEALFKELCNIGIFLVGALVAQETHSDYKFFGVFLICAFYSFRKSLIIQSLTNMGANILFYGGVQSYGALASLPIILYNGKPGKRFKYLFYIYYPLHLMVLYSIRRWIY